MGRLSGNDHVIVFADGAGASDALQLSLGAPSKGYAKVRSATRVNTDTVFKLGASQPSSSVRPLRVLGSFCRSYESRGKRWRVPSRSRRKRTSPEYLDSISFAVLKLVLTWR